MLTRYRAEPGWKKNILVFFGRLYISFVGCSVHSKYWLFGAATYELDRFTEFLPILMTSHNFSSLCHLPIVYICVTVLPILNIYNYEIITTNFYYELDILVQLMEAANLCTIHPKRVTVMQKVFNLAQCINGT